MRADVDLTNFTAGEISPRMRGRVDQANVGEGEGAAHRSFSRRAAREVSTAMRAATPIST